MIDKALLLPGVKVKLKDGKVGFIVEHYEAPSKLVYVVKMNDYVIVCRNVPEEDIVEIVA